MNTRARDEPPPQPWVPAPTCPLSTAPRSILLVMMSAVGDAVMVLPVLNALRRAFPESRIGWVLQPGPAELVKDHPAVDDVFLFHRRRGRSLPALVKSGTSLQNTAREIRDVAKGLPGESFDLLLDLQVYLKAGLVTALTPARVKLGFDRKRARDLNWLFTTHRIPPHPEGGAHVQDQYFEFLRFLGVNPDPLVYGLRISPDERRQQKTFFSGLPAPACAVVLAASRRAKSWSPLGYARLLEGLIADFGLHPVLVGGKSPPEEAAAEVIRRAVPASVEDARANDLRRLLWLLDGSALVVSPDTGPLHMARALEVPVVSLFGPTDPKRSGPYGLFQELVVDGYGQESGSKVEGAFRRKPRGMDRITPDMVLEKVEMALTRYGTRRAGSVD